MNNFMIFLAIISFIFNLTQITAQSVGDYLSYQSGNWNSTSTWQRYDGTDWVAATAVPTNSDGVITIKGGHTVTVNDTRTADQVVVEAGATLNITSGTFTIADGTGVDLTVNGTFNLSSNLSGIGSIEINGTMNWTAGNMSGGGTTTISSGATLIISGGSNKTIENGRNLDNYGTIYWTGGNIYFYATAILTNQTGGYFYIQTDYTIINFGGSGTRKIDNNGTIEKNTATGTTNSQIEINNYGNLIVNSGILTLSGGGTHSSSMTVAGGCTLNFNSNTTIGENVTLGGGGTYQHLGYDLTFTGTTNESFVQSGTTFNLTSGSIKGSGHLTINGVMNWTGGSMEGTGTTTISSSGSLTISGGNYKTLASGRNLVNTGTITWAGGDFNFSTTAILTNQTNGYFYIQTDYTVLNGGGSGTRKIDNYGTITKNTATGTTNCQIELNNYGNLFVNSGTLTLSGGGTHSSSITVSGGCTLNFNSNTTIGENVTLGGGGTYQHLGYDLTFTGTTNGSFVQSGTTFNLTSGSIKGSGHLTINGVMNWTGGSMEGTGTTTISSSGSLTISGGNYKTLASGRNLVNTGTITWTGGDFYFSTTAILTNQTNGYFYIQTDYTVLNGGGSGTRKIDNYGTIIRNTVTGTTECWIEVNNFGTISVYTGTLNLINLSNFSNGTLSGGKYNIFSATLRYASFYDISTLSAELLLNGSSSQIINGNNTNALASLTTITSGGKLTFENGRNYSVDISTLTNNGTIKLDGSNLTITAGSTFTNNGNLIFNNNATILGAGNFSTNSNSTLEIDNANGISSSGATGNIQNTGTRTFSTSANYTYKGTTAQITGSGLPSTVNNLTINNSHTSGVTLTNDLTVNGTLTLSNGDLALNGKTITLGNTANLVETPGNTITGTTGKITTTRTFNAGDLNGGLNIAGLGAKITTTATLGTTTIERMHNQAAGNSNTGISRIFRINPTNNSGLNATLEFYYDESELGGINENNLRLFKSSDGTNNSWNLVGGTADPENNKVSITNIDGFSYWTLGDITNPLPVELLSFTAQIKNHNVELKWQTATEVNNFGFNVECRVNNEEWKTIGFVKGSGNSNSPKEYSFVDNSPASSKLKYRLKQIDNDGSFTYSNEIEVDVDIPKVFALHQNYPNPFNPTTTITFTLAENGLTTLKIYNILGREVETLLNEELKSGQVHKVDFDGSGLSSGVYLCRLESKSMSKIKKLILLK